MKTTHIKNLSYFLFCLCLLTLSSPSFSQDIKTANKQAAFQTLFTAVKNHIEHEKKIYAQSSHNKENLHNKTQVKAKLHFLATIDQLVRNELINKINSYGKVAANKKESLYQAIQYMQEIDAFTIKQLQKILAIYSWVTEAEFGKQAARDAWLVLHHSRDNLLKYKALFILEQLIRQKKAEPETYALLYDTLAMESDGKFNIKQRYGSQFRANETSNANEMELYPYEGTINELNERRKNLGLSSIENYAAKFEAVCNCKVRL